VIRRAMHFITIDGKYYGNKNQIKELNMRGISKNFQQYSLDI